MSSLISQVGRRRKPVTAQLPLDTEVPLLNIHMVQVEGQIDVSSFLAERRVLPGWVRRRKRVSSGHTHERVGKAACRSSQSKRATPRRRGPKIRVGKRLGGVEENPIRSANALLPVPERVPSHADS